LYDFLWARYAESIEELADLFIDPLGHGDPLTVEMALDGFEL
jgi:hypothetical protein